MSEHDAIPTNSNEIGMLWKMIDEADAENKHLRTRLVKVKAENERLRDSLRCGAGSAINDLVARGLPPEWSPASGIGVMLSALGCLSLTLDDDVRAALAQTKEPDDDTHRVL